MKSEKIYSINSSDELRIVKNYHSSKAKPVKVIDEKSIQSIKFNVMPNKYVNEEVFIKEYRIWDDAIEAVFDRSYHTDMINSPNHLTFLSSLVNLQKMVYVFMHHYLSINYNKRGKEIIKVWPGKLDIDMPKMILKKSNINHLMVIKSVKKIKDRRYKVSADTVIDGVVTISGEALIIVL